MTNLMNYVVATLVATVGMVTDPVTTWQTAQLAASTAAANTACTVNCDQPTAVQKGTKVPVWTVAYCVIGPAGGPYTRLGCQDPRAVHIGPFGKPAKCFVGTDNKVHWATPSNVAEGRRFINHRRNGHWYVDWQD